MPSAAEQGSNVNKCHEWVYDLHIMWLICGLEHPSIPLITLNNLEMVDAPGQTAVCFKNQKQQEKQPHGWCTLELRLY